MTSPDLRRLKPMLRCSQCKSGPSLCYETCGTPGEVAGLAKGAARIANGSGFAPQSEGWSECVRQHVESRLKQYQLESFVFETRRFEAALLNESALEYALDPLPPPTTAAAPTRTTPRADPPTLAVEGQDVTFGGGGVIESLFSRWHLRHMDRWALGYVPSSSTRLGVCHQTLENLPGSILDAFNYTAAVEAGGMFNPRQRSELYYASGMCCGRRGFNIPFYLQFAQPLMLQALHRLHADRANPNRTRWNASDLRFASAACRAAVA